MLAELAGICGRNVDVIELATAGDVIRAEVLAEGRVLYQRDADAVLGCEASALSRYARYREEVADIMEQFRRTGIAYAERPR